MSKQVRFRVIHTEYEPYGMKEVVPLTRWQRLRNWHAAHRMEIVTTVFGAISAAGFAVIFWLVAVILFG